MIERALAGSLVRIWASNNRVVGAGVLVDRCRVLTCAHVVALALGVRDDRPDSPPGEVRLDFPLVAPDVPLMGRVVAWEPARADGGGDVAGLVLAGPLPPGTAPIHLIQTDETWGHSFRACGFPAGYPAGVWTSGVVRGPTAVGRVQIEDVKQQGYPVQPGFSGSPAWDEQLNGVIGLIVTADRDRTIKAGFIVPTALLVEAWPELAPRSQAANSLAHLQARLERLETAQQASSHPYRFQARIDQLRTAIAEWPGRVERQNQRIAQGLKEQRQRGLDQGESTSKEATSVAGQRPLDVTGFFKDREEELVDVSRRLAQPTTRLVSIIGHCGMGKTALACRILQDLERGRWPHTDEDAPLDGIVYLSTRTAGISLERLFLDAARVMGGQAEQHLKTAWTDPQRTTEEKIAYLVEVLGNSQIVILLDHVDDLIDDGGQFLDPELRGFFEHSLISSHGARLLVTSRTTLAFNREVMRFDQQVRLSQGLPLADGIALLRDLDPNGDCGLQNAPVEQLGQAVTLTHGVPRALEVLASILANDPFATLDDVLERFYQHEDVTQALIEENYRQLDIGARRVIEALSVFRRPVPTLAIDFMLEPFAPGLDVPAIVRRLAHTNSVHVDRQTKKVSLHPIDQDYAYSQLPEDGGDPLYSRRVLERRAADYYAQLRPPPETWKSIDDLAPLLAEFDHRIRAGEADAAGHILNRIDYSYLYPWGHYTRLVDMRSQLLDKPIDPRLQATNLGHLGLAYQALGQTERAVGLYHQALAIARETGDRRREGIELAHLGYAYRELRKIEDAIQSYQQALVLARETGDRAGEHLQLGSLGRAHQELWQVEQAIERYEEALAVARQIGADEGEDPIHRQDARRSEGVWLGHLGLAHAELGRIERARALHAQALAIAQETDDRRAEADRLADLGRIHRYLGQTEDGIQFIEQALAIARQTGQRWFESTCLGSLGTAHYALGEIDRAIQFHRQALAIARQLGHPLDQSLQLAKLSKALIHTGELTEAGQNCRQALALDVPKTGHVAALTLGLVLLHLEEPAATEIFADAVTRCQAILNEAPGLWQPRYILATALAGQTVSDPRWAGGGRRAELLAPAVAEYRRALEITSAPGIVQEATGDLELMRAAGVEGLEPALGVLEGSH